MRFCVKSQNKDKREGESDIRERAVRVEGEPPAKSCPLTSHTTSTLCLLGQLTSHTTSSLNLVNSHLGQLSSHTNSTLRLLGQLNVCTQLLH